MKRVLLLIYLWSFLVLGQDYKPCIDDSDCVGLGHTYACFLYMCYPWKDPSQEHPNCLHDSECFDGQGKCVKHQNVRDIPRGVCFHALNECNSHEDCPQTTTNKCCHQHCCPKEYFNKWKELPCPSDEFCQNMHLGTKCCSSTKHCCDGLET